MLPLEKAQQAQSNWNQGQWFRFWILPERPLPHPLDKSNRGSGDEIVFYPILFS